MTAKSPSVPISNQRWYRGG